MIYRLFLILTVLFSLFYCGNSSETVSTGIPVVVGITLDNPGNDTFDINTAIQLNAKTISINGASDSVKWISSNTAIAQVTNTGLVRGRLGGDVIINVFSVFDGRISNQIRLHVLEILPSVDSIVFPVDTIRTSNNQTINLDSLVTVHTRAGADASLIWKNDNSSVVNINSSNVLTGISRGMVNIRALSNFDSVTEGRVVVIVENIGITNISINARSNQFQQSRTITVIPNVITKGGATSAVTWTSSDTTKAVVSASGTVTGINLGSVTITAIAVADPTKTASFNFNITPCIGKGCQ